MRKLLPYEHQLVEALGISEEEYLEFVAVQQEYKDAKVGTALDIRNEPVSTTALVLTVVGVLFQVGAALLAPRPEIPGIKDRQRRNREQRFAPTFGFNSTQELASYGDPINLVYTNQNTFGDVRVAGSLVWSAVDSFGSTQFMRLLLVIGAGEIKNINYERTAFGQTSLTDLDRQNVFIFEDVNLDEDELSGPPPFAAINENFAKKELFPSNLKANSEDASAFVIPTFWDKRNGFSQAYTPTTSTSLGVFDVIPINVDVKTRDKDGDREEADIAIELKSVTGTDNYKWRNDNDTGATFEVNDKIQLFFNNAGYKAEDDAKRPAKQADNLRRQAVDSLDFGSTYMLGSAKFRLKNISDPRTIDDDEVTADFICVEQGQIPGTPYDEEDPVQENVNLRKSFEKAKRILDAENDDFDRSNLKASEIIPGNSYRIRSIGDGFDFTTIGASKNTRDIIFVAESTPTTASNANTVSNASVEGVTLAYSGVNIEFQGQQEVKWIPEYVASVSKNFDINNRQFTDAATPEDRIYVKRSVSYLNEKTRKIDNFGSINYTSNQLEDFLADKPVLSTSQLKRQINVQIDKLKKLIRKIDAGKFFDGSNDTLLQCENDFLNGFKTNPPANPARIANVQVFRWDRATFNNAKNLATGQAESGNLANRYYTDVYKDGYYYFTFLYIDSSGRWNFFNFNGIQTTATSEFMFPNDDKLIDRRAKLTDKEEKFYENKNKNRSLGVRDNLLIKEDAIEAGPTREDRRYLLNTRTDINNEDFTSNSASDAADKKNRVIETIDSRVNKLFEERHEEAIEVIGKDIELLEQLRDEIRDSEEEANGEKSGETDRVGTKAIKRAYKTLRREKRNALAEIKEALSDWDGFSQSFDNNFFTKCLVKADTASYSTLSECNMVNFSFKTKLFRRISGRQKKYGDEKMREYSEADNGIKSRMVFFRMSYRQYQADGKLGSVIILPYLCAIRHGSESDFYTQLSFYSPLNESQGGPTKWRFVFTPVYDIIAEIRARSFSSYIFLENSKNQSAVKVGNEYIFWYGRLVNRNDFKKYYPDEAERGPIYTNEWDMFSINSDTQTQFSFESGPEIQLTAVTEQQFDSSFVRKYKNMSMMAVGVYAGRGLQDLRSITALVKEGKVCRTVESIGTNAAPTASSSYAPDIFVDTVLDNENGIGKYVDVISVDKASLRQAKNFCINNNLPRQEGGGAINLFMDGLIADVGSWREFWINAAPFSLLELARKNGTDTLVPALPTNSDGLAADNNGLPIGFNVSALFTAGNILEGSYKEEYLNYGTATEDIIASVIYRKYNAKEVFSTKESVDVSLENPPSTAIRETFDLSQFVTQREQAIMFGKLLCNQRRYIRKGIEFQTFPSEAVIAPGDFIYVDVGMKHWDSYSAGMIMDGGSLNSPLLDARPNGTYQFLVYKGQTGETKSFSSVSVSNGVAPGLSDYKGWMFVMGTEKPQKRVYRVTELAIEEEGEVSVKALEYPCFESGGQLRARIADFRASKFTVS